jgi:hypothetical protein
MVIQRGLLNLAAVPVPLVVPLIAKVLPAQVLTVAYTVGGTVPPELVGDNEVMAVPTVYTFVAEL